MVQRVRRCRVVVESKTVGEIGAGLLVLLGVGKNDTETAVDYMVEKILGLRIFEDAAEKMNLSVQDIGGEVVVVSQFTLYGDVRRGKRPSFDAAAVLKRHGVCTNTLSIRSAPPACVAKPANSRP